MGESRRDPHAIEAAPAGESAAGFGPEERLARLRLLRSEHVGPATFRQLIARSGSAAAALRALPELARRGGRHRLRIATPGEAEAELAAVAAAGGRLLWLGEADYPAALAALDDAPPVLTVAGAAALLARPAVALVGARNASGNGRRMAELLARGLAEAGLTVVSGLARGIDTAAHQGALAAAGGGSTIAVLAGGLDRPYPPENLPLCRRIAEAGLLLAEMPPGTVPQARHFPRRNRLISGLSLAVVVVEAAERSGSLITARLAGEQGREVLAVPGSPLDPRAQGANRLIREGALLVQSVEDILEALGQLPSPRPRRPVVSPPATAPAQGFEDGADPTDDYRRRLLELLSPTPLSVDEAIRQCQFSASVVQTLLLELELAGRIERHAGNRISLIALSPDEGRGSA